MMTVDEARRRLAQMLQEVVDAGEARAMATVIVEDVMGYTATQMLVHSERELHPLTWQRMERVARSVISGEPLQYALGEARFRGRSFAVNPSVLIPRPETGQLVDMIVDAHSRRSDLRVLDIGTGSGCIAVSLALDLPFARVDAIDISPEAAETARANARALKARVDVQVSDVRDYHPSHVYDIIVSNPPYVLLSERSGMDRRVSEHEPSLALFVPDTDPVGIYEAIADVARRSLASNGMLYLEINPLCAGRLREMLRAKGLDDVQVVRDYHGAERFITCRQR